MNEQKTDLELPWQKPRERTVGSSFKYFSNALSIDLCFSLVWRSKEYLVNQSCTHTIASSHKTQFISILLLEHHPFNMNISRILTIYLWHQVEQIYHPLSWEVIANLTHIQILSSFGLFSVSSVLIVVYVLIINNTHIIYLFILNNFIIFFHYCLVP